METISQKNVQELTELEREQISALILRNYPTAQDQFIHDRVKVEKGYDIVLIKEKERILGVSYYRMHQTASPLLHTKSSLLQSRVPVIEFGSSYKSEKYSGNIIWRCGRWYASRKIGRFYPLKKVIGVSRVISPKVFENFKILFPHHYPNCEGRAAKPEVLELLRNIFAPEGLEIDDSFRFESPYVDRDEITEGWGKYYSAKNPGINEFFFENGIFVREGKKYYRTKKSFIVSGIRNPFRL